MADFSFEMIADRFSGARDESRKDAKAQRKQHPSRLCAFA